MGATADGDEEMEIDEPAPAKPQPTVEDTDVDDSELRIRKDYVPQVCTMRFISASVRLLLGVSQMRFRLLWCPGQSGYEGHHTLHRPPHWPGSSHRRIRRTHAH
jgi:hypothetical protein